MATDSIRRSELIERGRRLNRLLLKLREHPESFASEIYALPDNPTPNHLTRMLDDLRSLADEHGDRESDPREVWDLYHQVEEGLESLRQLLYQASAPADPFEDHR